MGQKSFYVLVLFTVLLLSSAFVEVASSSTTVFLQAPNTTKTSSVQSSKTNTDSPVCNRFFKVSNGTISLYPQNSPGAITVVSSVSQAELFKPSGYILFASGSQHSDTWETSSIGAQNYSVSANGVLVGGYLTCYANASLFLQKFWEATGLSAQTGGWSTNFTTNGLETLLVSVCDVYSSSNGADPCGPFSVNGVEATALQYRTNNASMTFYFAVINGSKTLSLNMAAPTSSASYEDAYIFVYNVSHSEYGWIKGEIHPLGAEVMLNHTRVNLTDGVLNLTLPYGFYAVNVSAYGYNNLSVVVEVYGGMTTPLSITLSTKEQAVYLIAIRLINVAVMVFGASVALLLAALSLFPNKFYKSGFNH